MNLLFEWQQPIVLYQNKQPVFTNEHIEEIKNVAGVYYFARMFGASPKPFYIGESLTLKTRLRSHLSNVNIVDVLRGTKNPEGTDIKQGARLFYYAYFRANKNQKPKRSIEIAQKFMIEEAVSQGFPLININLTAMKAHTIGFNGSKQFRGAFGSENYLPVSSMLKKGKEPE